MSGYFAEVFTVPEQYRYSDDGACDFEFEEGLQTWSYDGGLVFVRQCPHCARFVKPDETIKVNEEFGPLNAPNATCKVHDRVKMPFMGYF